jgi:hypothetical protein
MGRIRTIKPEFHAHEELSALPAETHLLAAALTNYADDEGYFNANPVLVKAGTNPLRDDRTTVEEQLEQLAKIGYLEIRKSGNKHYGRILTFKDHQRISHPTPSKLKDKFDALSKDSAPLPEDVRSPAGKFAESLRPEGNREQGTGNGMEVSKAKPSHPVAPLGEVGKVHPDLAIYQAYPRREGKGAAMVAINKAVQRLVKGEEPHPPMVKIEAQRYLMRRTLEYERSPVGRQPDKTKIPHPATWFNQSRYQDDQANWQRVNGASNGTFKGKTESSLDAAQQAIAIIRARGEAERDRIAAGEVGSEETGEASDGGLPGIRGGPDALRTDGYSIGPGVTIISPP